MGRQVYIETTIPSFYFEKRNEPEMIAKRDWTRKWWDMYAHHYELVTSEATLNELGEGDYPSKANCLDLVKSVKLLPAQEEITGIIEAYIDRGVMPKDPAGDALHLAMASFHKCDFLLTWNCKHLANANKFGHIRRTNGILGLFTPEIVTPLELLGGDEL